LVEANACGDKRHLYPAGSFGRSGEGRARSEVLALSRFFNTFWTPTFAGVTDFGTFYGGIMIGSLHMIKKGLTNYDKEFRKSVYFLECPFGF